MASVAQTSLYAAPMITPTLNINDVSQAIQLAVGPVFLLTGIAGILNVMTGRLARTVDRSRFLTEVARPQTDRLRLMFAQELSHLERRRHLASKAITATTLSALLVCMVVATLFLEVVLSTPLKWLVGVLFTGSTVALVVGLAFFLREVQLANQTVRILDPRSPD